MQQYCNSEMKNQAASLKSIIIFHENIYIIGFRKEIECLTGIEQELAFSNMELELTEPTSGFLLHRPKGMVKRKGFFVGVENKNVVLGPTTQLIFLLLDLSLLTTKKFSSLTLEFDSVKAR